VAVSEKNRAESRGSIRVAKKNKNERKGGNQVKEERVWGSEIKRGKKNLEEIPETDRANVVKKTFGGQRNHHTVTREGKSHSQNGAP